MVVNSSVYNDVNTVICSSSAVEQRKQDLSSRSQAATSQHQLQGKWIQHDQFNGLAQTIDVISSAVSRQQPAAMLSGPGDRRVSPDPYIKIVSDSQSAALSPKLQQPSGSGMDPHPESALEELEKSESQRRTDSQRDFERSLHYNYVPKDLARKQQENSQG